MRIKDSLGDVQGGGAAPKWRIGVLIACHDRRAKTLRCLKSLAESCDNAIDLVRVEVFLVDDGSIDGTATAVRTAFPHVHVISGDGSLYWCGAMRIAWREAAQHDFDAYFWLNDDVVLDENAVSRLLGTMREKQSVAGKPCIVVGATRDPVEGSTGPSYGALTASGVARVAHSVERIEYFNGNVVLVNRMAYRTLGLLSPSYQHGFADLDYGVRARRAGVEVWLAPRTLGECATNGTPFWLRRDVPLWQRLRELHRPTGCPPLQLARLVWQNGGWWFPWSVLKLYFHTFFPPKEKARA